MTSKAKNFNNSTDQDDLEKLIKKYKIYNKNYPFRGVFSRDELPTHLKNKNGYYILNLDSVKGDGTHWTSFVVGNDFCHYCDSFGYPPPEEVLNFCKERKITFNPLDFQSLTSELCGLFAVNFLKLTNEGYSFENIVNSFYNHNGEYQRGKNNKIVRDSLGYK